MPFLRNKVVVSFFVITAFHVVFPFTHNCDSDQSLVSWPNIFAGNDKIEIISCPDFESIPSLAATERPDLLQLLLSKNSISQIDATWIQNSQNIKTIELYSNNLTSIPPFNCGPPGSEGCPELIKIRLHKNLITNVLARSFANHSKLEEISLQENKIITLASLWIIDCTLLKIIELQDNAKLTEFRISQDSENLVLKNLQTLRLDGCNISSLDPMFLSIFPKLTELHIYGNPINVLPIFVSSHPVKIHVKSMTNFTCDCSTTKLAKGRMIQSDNEQEFCGSPDYNEGKSFSQLDCRYVCIPGVGRCFWKILSPSTLNYQEASDFCASNKLSISTLETKEIYDFFYTYFGNIDNLWIGLTDEGTEGVFRWSSGRVAEYVRWANYQPRGGTTRNCFVSNAIKAIINMACELRITGTIICQDTIGYPCIGENNNCPHAPINNVRNASLMCLHAITVARNFGEQTEECSRRGWQLARAYNLEENNRIKSKINSYKYLGAYMSSEKTAFRWQGNNETISWTQFVAAHPAFPLSGKGYYIYQDWGGNWVVNVTAKYPAVCELQLDPSMPEACPDLENARKTFIDEQTRKYECNEGFVFNDTATEHTENNCGCDSYWENGINRNFIYMCVEFNECNSSPCLNGGSCIDLLNSFECQCEGDYYGVHCQSVTTMRAFLQIAVNNSEVQTPELSDGYNNTCIDLNVDRLFRLKDDHVDGWTDGGSIKVTIQGNGLRCGKVLNAMIEMTGKPGKRRIPIFAECSISTATLSSCNFHCACRQKHLCGSLFLINRASPTTSLCFISVAR